MREPRCNPPTSDLECLLFNEQTNRSLRVLGTSMSLACFQDKTSPRRQGGPKCSTSSFHCRQQVCSPSLSRHDAPLPCEATQCHAKSGRCRARVPVPLWFGFSGSAQRSRVRRSQPLTRSTVPSLNRICAAIDGPSVNAK